MPTTTSATDRMLQQVHNLVEPLTRYSVSSLSIAPGATVNVPVHLEVRDSVQFAVRSSRHSGAAPGSLTHKSSEADALSAARDQIAEAQRLLPQKLARWAIDLDVDESLSASSCHDGFVDYGATLTCGNCSGSGDVSCRSCGGRAQERCSTCSGSGNARCSSCSGGRVSCSSCSGQRGRNVPRGTGGDFEWQQCYSCGGSGTQSCNSCGGRGTKTCLSCSGGWIPCRACSGSGRTGCSMCNKSGKTHVHVSVDCTVNHQTSRTVRSNDAQIAAELQALPRQQLLSYADMKARTPVLSQSAVTRVYELHVDVSEISIPVSGSSLRLLGLGTSARIHDFRNVVGALLATDVEMLQRATREHTWLHRKPAESLERALEVVLDSEANEGILARKRKKSATSEDISREFSGAVSPEFVLQLQRAFKSALWRAALFPIASPMIGSAAFTTLVSFGFSYWLSSARALSSPWQPFLMAFMIAALGASGAEWQAVKRLGRTFDGPSWTKITPLLRRYHVLNAARAAAAAVFVVLFSTLMFTVGMPR